MDRLLQRPRGEQRHGGENASEEPLHVARPETLPSRIANLNRARVPARPLTLTQTPGPITATPPSLSALRPANRDSAPLSPDGGCGEHPPGVVGAARMTSNIAKIRTWLAARRVGRDALHHPPVLGGPPATPGGSRWLVPWSSGASATMHKVMRRATPLVGSSWTDGFFASARLHLNPISPALPRGERPPREYRRVAGGPRRGGCACKACGGELRGVANRDGRPFRARGQDAQGTHRSEPASLGGQAKRNCRFLRQFRNLLIYALLARARSPPQSAIAPTRGDPRRRRGQRADRLPAGGPRRAGAGGDPRADPARRPRCGATASAGRCPPPRWCRATSCCSSRRPGAGRPAADRRRALRIDEAVLTGESVPVDKAPQTGLAGAALGDRLSMAFSGSFVTAGAGAGRRGGDRTGERARPHRRAARRGRAAADAAGAADAALRAAGDRRDAGGGDAGLRLRDVCCAATRPATPSWPWSGSRSRRSPRACRR